MTAQDLARGLVRAWTRLYTWRLPPVLRDRRCEEIESDLWESEHDAVCADAGHAARTIVRLLIGVPDDLGWRLEQEGTMRVSRAVMMTVSTAACAIVATAFWLVQASLATDAPPAPQAPRAMASDTPAPEPPPPPPPPALPGKHAARPSFEYATVAYRVVGGGASPRLAKNVRTVYPPIARAAALEGTVVVRATVMPDGRLSNTRVVRSIPIFDQAVLDAVRQWQFTPTRIDARPVETPIEVVARFTR
jgi:TonB family protein